MFIASQCLYRGWKVAGGSFTGCTAPIYCCTTQYVDSDIRKGQCTRPSTYRDLPRTAEHPLARVVDQPNCGGQWKPTTRYTFTITGVSCGRYPKFTSCAKVASNYHIPMWSIPRCVGATLVLNKVIDLLPRVDVFLCAVIEKFIGAS
jgi:hypothetical protein